MSPAALLRRIRLAPLALVLLAPASGAAASLRPDVESEEVLWRGRADLDGDGAAEDIALTSTLASRDLAPTHRGPRVSIPLQGCGPRNGACPAVLHVRGASWPIQLTSGFSLEIIDIDASDRRKELLLTQRGLDGDEPWIEFQVLLFESGQLHAQALWHSSGFDGGTAAVERGRLVLRVRGCPEVATVAYRRSGLSLVEVSRRAARGIAAGRCGARAATP